MPWAKMRNLLQSRWVLVTFFVLAFVFTRGSRLNSDIVNPDGVNWHYRSQQFVVALKTKNFGNTFQHYHPGVTLMWVTGIPIELYKQVTGQNVYTEDNFSQFDLVAKGSLVFVQLVLTLYILSLLAGFIGFYRGLLVTVLFTFEPFFIGNSRLYHLDVLLALLSFISLLLMYKGLKFKAIKFVVLASFFIAMAVLTKSIGLGLLGFAGCFALFLAIKNKSVGYFKYAFVLSALSISVIFLFFPALWVDPVKYLTFIFSEINRVGFVNGHNQIIFGEYTEDAGIYFYFLVLALKFSPLILAGVIAFLFAKNKSKFSELNVFLIVFYVAYFIVMTIPSKKLDRYMVQMFPFFAYFAVLGFENILVALRAKNYSRFVLSAFFGGGACVFILLPFITTFPYPFLYTSPIFGTPASANKLLAQKSFGVGMYDLKTFIIKTYGAKPKLGFLDPKPMQAIYPNSKIFDIREYGPKSYDLVVLGVNEALSDKVLASPIKLEKTHAIYINGLEYWRIYEKSK